MLYRQRPRRMMYWLQFAPQQIYDTKTGEPLTREQMIVRADQNLQLAGISVGFSVFGWFYVPASYISLAITLFTANSTLVRALIAASGPEPRVTRDTVGISILYLLAGANAYFWLSVLHWVFTLNERNALDSEERLKQLFEEQPTVTMDEFVQAVRQLLIQLDLYTGNGVIIVDAKQQTQNDNDNDDARH